MNANFEGRRTLICVSYDVASSYDDYDSIPSMTYYGTMYSSANPGPCDSSAYTAFSNYGNSIFFITRDGGNVKLFKSLQQAKEYLCGEQSVYITNSYTTYSPTSTTYSGNYVNNSNIENDYSTIQETIDNSSETTTIDESTVNNIVNNYYTENIYNYSDDSSSSGCSSDDSSSDSDSSSWLETLTNGLGSLVSGIASLLGVLVDAIGDLLVTVSDLVGSVMDSISNLSGSFSSFGDFLSVTFAWIPDEVWSAIALGFEVAVVLMVVKFIKEFI